MAAIATPILKTDEEELRILNADYYSEKSVRDKSDEAALAALNSQSPALQDLGVFTDTGDDPSKLKSALKNSIFFDMPFDMAYENDKYIRETQKLPGTSTIVPGKAVVPQRGGTAATGFAGLVEIPYDFISSVPAAGAIWGKALTSMAETVTDITGDPGGVVKSAKASWNAELKASTPANPSMSFKVGQNIIGNLPTLALAIRTGNANAALNIMGAMAGFSRRADLRDKGYSPAMATVLSVPESLAEMIGEKYQMDVLLRPAMSLGKRALASMALDVFGEDITYTLNAAMAKLTDNPKMTGREFLEGLWETTQVAAVSGPVMGAISHVAVSSEKPVPWGEMFYQAAIDSPGGLAGGEAMLAVENIKRKAEAVREMPPVVKEMYEGIVEGLEAKGVDSETAHLRATDAISETVQGEQYIKDVVEVFNELAIMEEEVALADRELSELRKEEPEAFKLLETEKTKGMDAGITTVGTKPAEVAAAEQTLETIPISNIGKVYQGAREGKTSPYMSEGPTDRGYFFTTDKEYAQRYAGENGAVAEFSIASKNILNRGTEGGETLYRIASKEAIRQFGSATPRSIRMILEELGYDAIYNPNVKKQEGRKLILTNELVVFNPDHIVSSQKMKGKAPLLKPEETEGIDAGITTVETLGGALQAVPGEIEAGGEQGEQRGQLADDVILQEELGKLSKEETHEMLLFERGSGAGTRTAYWILENKKPADIIGISDARGLGAVDAYLGHKAGDDFTKMIVEAHKIEGVPVYRASAKGDEFLTRWNGITEEEVSVKLEAVNNRLRKSILVVVNPDGTKRYFTNLELYIGVGGGKDGYNKAGHAVGEQKRTNQPAGYVKGEFPRNIIELSEEEWLAKTGSYSEILAGTARAAETKPKAELKPAIPTTESMTRQALGKGRIEAHGGGMVSLPKDRSVKDSKASDMGAISPERVMELVKNPSMASRLKALGFHIDGILKIFTGEKSLAAKLAGIPHRVAKLYSAFRPAFNSVQMRSLEANEITNKIKKIFDDDAVDKIIKTPGFGEALFAEQERNVTVFKLQPEGLLDLGLASEGEIANYNKISKIIPKKQTGITNKLVEYLDKNVYEGLIDIANKLGIKHSRVLKAGRGKLGYAVEDTSEIVTQYATELSVLAHEIGHQVDFKYNLWSKIIDRAEGIGKKGKVTETATKELKSTIQKELRALADLTFEGLKVTPYYKKKVRKKAEKMAFILEAYIHAPERFSEVAPNVKEAFEKFIEESPELALLPGIKQGLALVKNEIYASGNLSNIIRDYIKSGGSEQDVMDYLNIGSLLSEKRSTAKEWGTDKVTPVEQNGWKYSSAELKNRGIDEGAHNKSHQARELATDLYIERIKIKRGYYDADTTEIEKKIMDIEINEAVRRYGAYMPIQRTGNYGLEYSIDGERAFSTYETRSELEEAKTQFAKMGVDSTEVDMKDNKARERLYPVMSLHQLDELLDKAEISKNDGEITKLRDILKARMGSSSLIHREFVPGFERTGEHAVRTIEAFVENSIKGYTKALINKEAGAHIAAIENTDLQEYAQRYLDNFNSAANDKAVFKGIRQIASIWMLGAKPTYIVQNIFSELRTLNRLHRDEGFGAGSSIFAKAHEDTAKYVAHRMAMLAGKKDFNAGLDPEYIELMDRLMDMQVIGANFVNEFAGLGKGMRTKSKAEHNKDLALSTINALASTVDKLTREHATTAAYMVAKKRGLDKKATLELMVEYSTDTQTAYDPYNIPVLVGEWDQKLLAGGAKMGYLFQQYSLDWTQQMSGFIRGAIAGNEKIADLRGVISSVGTLGFMAGLKGVPLALLMGSVFSALTGDDPWRRLRERIQEMVPDLTALNKTLGTKISKHDVADIAIYGILSKAIEKDVSGILGLGTFPFGLVIKNGEIEIQTAIGGLWDRGGRALKFSALDETWKATAELMPDVIRNIETGKRWEEEGRVTTIKGIAVKLGEDVIEPTEREILWKKIGLTPLRLSVAYEEMIDEMRLSTKRKEYSAYFYGRMVAARISEDSDRIEKVNEELDAHNDRYPEMKIELDRDTVKEKMKAVKSGKSIKDYPKSIRGEILRRRDETYTRE